MLSATQSAGGATIGEGPDANDAEPRGLPDAGPSPLTSVNTHQGGAGRAALAYTYTFARSEDLENHPRPGAPGDKVDSTNRRHQRAMLVRPSQRFLGRRSFVPAV